MRKREREEKKRAECERGRRKKTGYRKEWGGGSKKKGRVRMKKKSL